MGEIVKIKSVEYWTIQYKTSVLGEGMTFWPPEGFGRWESQERADWAASQYLESKRSEEVRIMHVTQTIEYGDPIYAKEGEVNGE